MTTTLFAADALLPGGWAKNVRLTWDDTGTLTAVQVDAPDASGAARARGPVLPGLPNLHSHAFQRAFAGLTEYRAGGHDSFWSWRTLMYRFAARLTPADVESIATWLYVEMLEAGYTHVCEFQYLHHAPDGRPYTDDATLSLALLRAAEVVGIGFTLLPVLYQTSGFGSQTPQDGQRRFIRSTESMLRLLEALKPVCAAAGVRLGLAPHSLRAVPPEALREVLAGLDAIDATAPIHLHIAEQAAEVEACLQWCGQRPVEWLLAHAPVDARWCLVHATHLNAGEVEAAARSGAVAGLCPSTEANLGDGLFAFSDWRRHGGHWGLGSDSHVCVDAAEELMLLEYGQRLATGQRNVGADPGQPQVAAALLLAAVGGGARAAGLPLAGLRAGQRADFVVLDPDHLALQGLTATDMLSAHVFARSRGSAVESVWVAGQPRVVAGRHPLHDQAVAGFVGTRTRLLRDG